MEFHVVTGFGSSTSSFCNNSDPHNVGQRVFQGSSSAAPLYTINSDVCLTTYRKLAKGATFLHPANGSQIEDIATQYVDDKTNMIDDIGAALHQKRYLTDHNKTHLFNTATNNSNTWASLLWISGRQLYTSKCYYYF